MRLVKKILKSIQRIKNPDLPPGNNLTIFNDDTFIVSYPRSGNTWMRFLLGKYLFGDNFDFVTKEKFIPAINGNSDLDLKAVLRPRIMKSHSSYCQRYPKVIYLIRDPRDVFVSHYYWFLKYPDKWKFDKPFSIEKYGKYFFEGWSKFSRWDNHYNSWKNNKNNIPNGILFIRYEDLKEDTLQEMGKILKFLNITEDNDRLSKSINDASFSAMSRMETEQQHNSKELSLSNKEIKFVRSGKSEWNIFFTPDIKDTFKKEFGSILIELKYEQDTNW